MTLKGKAHKITSHWIARVNLRPGKSADELLIAESVPLIEPEFQERCCCLILDGPDSVWSWVIACVNFLINFIIIGLARMSGILYVEFMDYFGISRKTASIPFSIQLAGRNLFGPLTGICGQKYGLRLITILGGLIGSLSAAAIFFELDILTVIIAWGIFFGLSAALTTTLNQISIDQYFEENRATAGGFATSGGCVGALVFPEVLETLLHAYSIRGTFLILAGIILLVVPAGIMLIEPPWLKRRQEHSNPSPYGSIDSDDSSWSEEFAKEGVSNCTQPSNAAKKPQNFVDFKLLKENSEMVFRFLTMEVRDRLDHQKAKQKGFQKFNKPRLLTEMESIYASILGQSHPFIPEEPHGPSGDVPMRSNDLVAQQEAQEGYLLSIIDDLPLNVYIRNRLRDLGQFQGMNLVARFPYWEQSTAWNVLVELRKLHEIISDQAFMQRPCAVDYHMPKPILPGNRNKPRNKKFSDTFCSHMKTSMSLHANPIFLLICLSRAVYNLTFCPVVMIIVDFAIDMGLPMSDGKYVVSLLSAGDLFGRLCMGWITDCKFVGLPLYMLLGMLALGASSAALPLLESRAALLAGIFVFGLLQGSLYIRHPILVSKYLEPHEQAIGMGCINFLSGFLVLGAPSLIGYFRDELGSYNMMFYINGALCAAVGLIWTLEPLFLLMCSANHNEKRNTATS